MCCKVQCLAAAHFAPGDRVFVLDTDLLIQAPIFDALDGDDVVITSRHYPYWYPVNGGVWGFCYSDTARQFLDFYVSQLMSPTWLPFARFQSRFGHAGNLDWWCDQDLLCAVFLAGLPFPCVVRDIGPLYNYCPSVEAGEPDSFLTARSEIQSRLGDTEYKILHFKGRLSEIMPRLY